MATTSITAVHRAVQAVTIPTDTTDLRLVIVAATTTACTLLFLQQLESLALMLALSASVARVVVDYPHSANHAFLESSLLALALILGRGHSRQLNATLPTIAGLVLVWSGVQKAISDGYLRGYVLAFFALEDSRFTPLQAFGPTFRGGCYEAPVMLTVLSVIIVAAEILLGLAVCWRRTRRLGGVGCVVLLLGIELFARELTFGGLMLALLFHAFGSRASAAASYALTATFVVGGCIALASFSLV